MKKTLLTLTIFAIVCSCAQLKDMAGLDLRAPTVTTPGGVDVGSAIDAGGDVLKAATLSDAEVAKLGTEYAQYSDTNSKLAGTGSSYAKRLVKMTARHAKEDGLKLNFKVYVDPTVNAFALADGSIRIYSGLMDLLTDDEVMSVIGHEIGHVKNGDVKRAMQVAYTASAASKGAMSVAGSVQTQLATAALSAFGEKLINAQFSQSQERAADEYGMNFLVKNGYDPRAAVSALRKLAALGGSHSFLSSHPDPANRAKLLEEKLSKNGVKLKEPAPAQTPQTAPAPVKKEADSPVTEVELPVEKPAATMQPAAAVAKPAPAVEAQPAAAEEQVKRDEPEPVTPALLKKYNSGLRAGWYIQLARFNDRLEAEIEASAFTYRNLGVQVASVQLKQDGNYYLIVGPFAEQSYAEKSMAELKDDGLTGSPRVIEIKP